MNEKDLIAEAQQLDGWQQHKFMVLVAMTILVSLVLVSISLWLYNSSGAAQLDLSRPGYQSVRDQVSSEEFTGFSSSGTLDKAALNQFREMYEQQLEAVTVIDSFSGDVMSDKALGLDAPQ